MSETQIAKPAKRGRPFKYKTDEERIEARRARDRNRKAAIKKGKPRPEKPKPSEEELKKRYLHKLEKNKEWFHKHKEQLDKKRTEYLRRLIKNSQILTDIMALIDKNTPCEQIKKFYNNRIDNKDDGTPAIKDSS